jgi:hypothetical protein
MELHTNEPEPDPGAIESPAPIAARDARALIGWMPPDQACTALLGGQAGVPVPIEVLARARRARDAVEQRSGGLNQSGLLSDLPPELNAYTTGRMAHPALAAFVAEGWRPQLADLRRVVALQPQVFADHADRAAAISGVDDLRGIAEVSMPFPKPTQLPCQFDPVKRTWIFSSPNQNLRVISHYGGEVQPGVAVFGFAIGVQPSMMQVVRVQDRLLLRDGYHRAHALLLRGIHEVPVLFREFPSVEELGIGPGMLVHGEILGDRPPTLSDYFDDEVAASVRLPSAQKIVVVQALELTPAA